MTRCNPLQPGEDKPDGQALPGLCVGLVLVGHALFGATGLRWPILAAGICATAAAIVVYTGLRQQARTQIRQLDEQIATITCRPDGPVLVAAAQAARMLLLEK